MRRPQSFRPKWLIGIDEVGRGPLAGPVLLGFVKIDFRIANKLLRKFQKIHLNDSKKISAQKRRIIMSYALKCREQNLIEFTTTRAYPEMIDEYGINESIRRCIRRGLKRLNCEPQQTKILLDGSLFAPTNFIYQKTIIKGDEKEPIISLASIIAKVTRDSYMEGISRKYPDYYFSEHKGYGTLRHRKALKTHGLSPLHRRSFCRYFI